MQEALGEPMAGLACYLFAANGAYLGRRSVTNDQGQAAFELADGNYRIRVDYLGYAFWAPAFAIPAASALAFDISHEDTLITVKRDYNGDVLPGENIPL